MALLSLHICVCTMGARPLSPFERLLRKADESCIWKGFVICEKAWVVMDHRRSWRMLASQTSPCKVPAKHWEPRIARSAQDAGWVWAQAARGWRENSLVRWLLPHSHLQVIFGFGCDSEEREQRLLQRGSWVLPDNSSNLLGPHLPPMGTMERLKAAYPPPPPHAVSAAMSAP